MLRQTCVFCHEIGVTRHAPQMPTCVGIPCLDDPSQREQADERIALGFLKTRVTSAEQTCEIKHIHFYPCANLLLALLPVRGVAHCVFAVIGRRRPTPSDSITSRSNLSEI